MAIDESEFRRVLGHFASGVTVVTVAHEEAFYGITVSSFTSLSLNPRLVLICLNKFVTTHTALVSAGTFAINVLDEESEHLSRHFAGREADKFRRVSYHSGLTGAPLLDAALATIECRVTQQVEGGDHTIFIGEVLTVTAEDRKPLIYFRSGYHKLD